MCFAGPPSLHLVSLPSLHSVGCPFSTCQRTPQWTTALSLPHLHPCFSQAQLLLVGDMGLYNSRAWPALSADASSGAYDALLHVGDLAYDMAGLQGRRGAAFLAHIEPAAAQLPYMVVPGNHEWHASFSHYR